MVWLTVKGTDGEEALVHCTFNYLIRLAADRRFRGKYGLADMCRFEDIIDQKGDAAWRLHSWEIIELLERHAPQDRGTILAISTPLYSHLGNESVRKVDFYGLTIALTSF